MPQRQVDVTLATYIDEAGVCRHALQGATVNVHPGHVERFDRLNVIAEPVAELVAEVESTPTDQAEPTEPAEIEPVADVLELDTPPAPKRTRRKAPVNKGE
jgi:hypothetical protein